MERSNARSVRKLDGWKQLVCEGERACVRAVCHLPLEGTSDGKTKSECVKKVNENKKGKKVMAPVFCKEYILHIRGGNMARAPIGLLNTQQAHNDENK
jgi:hypothetical protein